MSNKVEVEIPPYTPSGFSIPDYVQISVTVSANNIQFVHLLGPEGEDFDHWLSGKGNDVIGNFSHLRTNKPIKFSVEFNHQPGMLTVIKPSAVKVEKSKVGNYNYVVLSSEDGGDQDFNDSVVTFRYLDTSAGQQKPAPESSNKVTIEIPPWKPSNQPGIPDYTHIHFNVNAENLQRVHIKAEGASFPFEKFWSGKGNRVIASHGLERVPGKATHFTLEFTHQPGLATVINPSKVRVEKKQIGHYVYVVVSAEDGHDKDYNDAVVTFRYLNNSR